MSEFARIEPRARVRSGVNSSEDGLTQFESGNGHGMVGGRIDRSRDEIAHLLRMRRSHRRVSGG
jgi:hypothetical protein